jgi:hypothetical protein
LRARLGLMCLAAAAPFATTVSAQAEAEPTDAPPAAATLQDIEVLDLQPVTAVPPLPVVPDPGPQQVRRAGPTWQGSTAAVNEQTLDRLRGGFQAPTGLQMSFGIERVVYINGVLTTSTRIGVEGLGAVAGAVAPPPVFGGTGLSLVQNGGGNTFLPGVLAPSAQGTVIQNTLNDQRIQTLTVINANANSLDVLRSWSLQMSIREAVTGSVRR